MAYRKSLDFLPSVFKTTTNEKILRATLDQLISEPEVRQLNGYVGRKFNPALTPKDSYIQEDYADRQNYQLEPATVYTDDNGNIQFVSSYPDLLSRIESLGGNISNPSRLFSADQYTYSGLFDFDKFVNYSNYYWLPNGPDSIPVFATTIPTDQDIGVTVPDIYSVVDGKYDQDSWDNLAFDVTPNSITRLKATGYTFDISGADINPTIRVARGGTYRFNVNQIGHGFYLQTAPGTAGSYAWQNNLSIREVMGVENNGEDVGTVTFNVPARGAQDFFINMPVDENVSLVAHSYAKRRNLRYTEIQNANYEELVNTHLGLDGQRFIDGKIIVFLPGRSDSLVPQPWQAQTDYLEGDLLTYANTVYRAMTNYRSGRTFNTTNLEVYDAEDHWYDPALFDATDTGFGSGSFDRGDTVPEEARRGWFQVAINDEGIVELTAIDPITTSHKVTILEGIQYGNREVYRSSINKLELVPPITANLDRLYYQDALDPNLQGIIEIIDQDNNLEVNIGSILDNDYYTSPNGVVFESGLKVRFIGQTNPPEYENNTFYVEGVGRSIELVPIEQLDTPEPWLDVVSSPYDSNVFDVDGFDQSQPAPVVKQYINIKRNSREGSAWARQNRWFHESVIRSTNVYNGFNTVLNQDSRAKRPIIEFDPNLQLFNFGQRFAGSVNVVDNFEIDALSNVEGQPVDVINGIVSGYYSDGVPLVSGNRIVFAADTAIAVRNKIWRVDWITPGSPENTQVLRFDCDGSTLIFPLSFDVINSLNVDVKVDNVTATTIGYSWALTSPTEVQFTVAPPDGAVVTIAYTFERIIHLVAESNVETGDVVLSTLGDTAQGTSWFWDGTNWKLGQSKTASNQFPLFDLYTNDNFSLSDESVYPSSNFSGSPVFAYKIGNSVKDSELDLRLAYRSIGNVGDILFTDWISTGIFSYEGPLETAIVGNTNGSNLRINNADGTSSYVNQWIRLADKTKQYQTETFFGTQYQKNRFKLNVFPTTINAGTILVYKNNNPIAVEDFDIEVDSGIGYLILNENIAVNDKIEIKIFTNKFTPRSVWEIPSNLENNALNVDISEITLGQMRSHILETFIKTEDLKGVFQGSNNVKDLGPIKQFGGKIVQNAGAPHLANLFLNDTKANFVESVLYAQREYSRFKNKFQQLAGTLPLTNVADPIKSVDEIIAELSANKNTMFPYYHSDMLPYGDDFRTLTYTVNNPSIGTYYLTEAFDINAASSRAVLVYLNGEQMTYGRDYTFGEGQPVININIAPELPEDGTYYVELFDNDVITIKEYRNTDGSHIPQTPSKMGLYPAYRPRIIEEGYDGAYTNVIRGHDGSLTVAYNDYRDAIILELELRMFNNIKSRYTGELFDIQGLVPGKFRDTDYTREEFTTIISSNFSSWLGTTGLRLSDNTTFDSNDPFTWNYARYADRIDGNLMEAAGWRGIYNYYYDTDQPQLRPWEMLGFSEQPDWWVNEYGPSPYTSGNTVLWLDLEAGHIRRGDRAGDDARYARPGLSTIIPVDDSGMLLPPFNTIALNTSTDTDSTWRFGDGSPVESAWRQSADYPFALQIAAALMKPAEYFGLLRDTNRQSVRNYDQAGNTQWEFIDTGIRSTVEYVHGEMVDGEIYLANGYPTWIAEYATSLSLDIAEAVGRKLRGVDLRLAYKVGGYTDKKYLKLFADQSSPDSINSSIVIPDDDFQIKLVKSAPRVSVTYSGVIVTKSGNGWAVTGYDQVKPYFVVERAAPSGPSTVVKVGKDAVEVYRNGNGSVVAVPYGTEFLSKAEVVDFLVGLGRYQSSKGFRFDRQVEDQPNEKHDWFLAAKEFLFWTQQGWESDVAITLSPIGDEVSFRSNRGAVDTISNRPSGTRILGSNSDIIDPADYTVSRDGRDFTLKTNNSRGVFLVDVDVVDYEHVIVLNNTTQFNDIIYQPDLGNRQFRIKITGIKTGNWDGTFGAAGFIINDNNIMPWQVGKNYYKGEIVTFKNLYYVALMNVPGTAEFDTSKWVETEYAQVTSTLLPNLASKAGQPKSFYDFNNSNLELDADRLGKQLIGFSPRSYLDNLGISDTSQVKFYQGLIGQKGSNNSLDKLLRAKLDNFDGKAEFYEQWALRSGAYGATDNTRQVRVPISQDNGLKDPILIELLAPNDDATDGRVGYKPKDLLVYPRPYDKNILSNRDRKRAVNDLPSAGYIKTNEVDYISIDIAGIPSSIDKNVADGSRIWIAIDDTNDWQVFRFTDVNLQINSIGVNGLGVATVKTKTPHGLDATQKIVIKTSENSDFTNYYVVKDVIDALTFTVQTQFVQTTEGPVPGRVYTLVPLRQDSIDDIMDITPVNGWRSGDQFYLENGSVNGWAVYEKANVYTDVSRYYDSTTTIDAQLGASVAVARNNSYLIAGSPNTNTVQTYQKLANGTLNEDAEITSPSVGLVDFGAVLSASSVDYIAVGSPESISGVGTVHILRKGNSGAFEVAQAIVPYTLDVQGEFGSAIALSDNARWLFVGQPGFEEGYIWAYQLTLNDTGIVDTFIADGSTATFTLSGDAIAAADGIDSLRVSDFEGKLYLPDLDYTFDGTNVTFFSAPVFGEINIALNSFYKFVYSTTLGTSFGDRFGASLATSTDGSQLIVGAPNATTGVAGGGKVYILDRLVESQFADGLETVFTVSQAINGEPLVQVDGVVLLDSEYVFDGIDTITFAAPPSAGSIVTIDINDAVQSAELEDGESDIGSSFGYSLDLCPTNCSLYVGAPFEDAGGKDTGSVYRYINQGKSFGSITGSVVNPTLTANATIAINNFWINFTIGDNLNAVVTKINNAGIPGVGASAVDNKLTIVSDSTVFADKLNLVLIDAVFGVDIGLDIYASQQVIVGPRTEDFANFGKVVKIGPDSQTLVVASDRASSELLSTFDDDTTVFDNRTTRVSQLEKQSGAAYVYQYISKPTATVEDPGKFILAETLFASDTRQFDLFGASIAISENAIYVGAPGNNNLGIGNSGVVYGFVKPLNTYTWNVKRTEQPKVNLELVNGVYLYSQRLGEKIIDLDIVDPAKGRVSGTAQQEINYQTTVDPALYNNVANTTRGIIWGEDHIGELWWDTGRVRWTEYEQDTVEYRAASWGFAFPGSTIICAEWTESLRPPANYDDPNNPGSYPLFPESYNTFLRYDENTGQFISVYYYWVAGKTRIPKNILNRRISAVQIEELIADPKLGNVPFAAFYNSSTFGLYNVNELLTGDDIVLVIDYDVKQNNNVLHSEYTLIAEGDPNSRPADTLLTKMIDSLSGQDSSGNLVPDVGLNQAEKFGVSYRPRQSMFVDRRNAVRECVEYMNRFMAALPVVYTRDITMLTRSEPFPDIVDYNEAVETYVELTYLVPAVLAQGYKVLVKADEQTRGRWVVYSLSGSEWVKSRIQSYDNSRYITPITWTDPAITVPDLIETVIDFEFQLQSIVAAEGDFVKIKDNGLGLFKVVYRENNRWRTVQEENGTLAINASIWKTEVNRQGWDNDGFGLQLFDDWPSTEIANICRAMYNDIFTEEQQLEKNQWFIHMVKYAMSESSYVEWAFKTSFIKINQTQRGIRQIPVYQRDNQDLIRQYIEEVKPYHTKISEFVLQYDGSDVTTLNTTDFDLPAYFNFSTNTYRSPTGATVEDDIVLDLAPYTDWTNNYTLSLDSVDVPYGGYGYFTAPELRVVGGGGSGATVTSVVASGSIVAVVVTNPGSGYITTPSIEVLQYAEDPAQFATRMVNRKVRSFDTTMKFDRVANNTGWLVEFKDGLGQPVDVRGELISRVTGEHGVLDEVVNALSNGNWLVADAESLIWPVALAPDIRFFDDVSGRVQIFTGRDDRGWSDAILANYIRSFGVSAGINGLDVTGTTVTTDGTYAKMSSSLLSYVNGVTYFEGEIIFHNDALYRVTAQFTAGAEFDLTYLEDYTGADLESHLNRTWAYYKPTDGMLGRDLSQLFTGTKFPGVTVIGANFNQNPGFDVGGFDNNAYDLSIIGPEGVSVIDPSILDQTLYSEYLDSELGTRPEDIITAGGSYVDTYHSHAPEEHVPGQVFDTLNIRVHTVPTSESTRSGFAPLLKINRYVTNGVTTRFKFEETHTGDYLLVYRQDGGPRYREVTASGQALPGVIPPGSFYEVSNNRSYTVDYETKEIVFANAPIADDVMTIYSYGQAGESIISTTTLLGDGSTFEFDIVAPYNQVAETLVLVNGVLSTGYVIAQSSDLDKTTVIFDTPPAVDDHITVVASADFERNSISSVYTQIEMVSNTERTVTLDQNVRYDRSKDTVMIVELNGNRLRPGNTNYYTGDDSTVVFYLPTSGSEVYTSLTYADVQVWIDGTQAGISDYTLSIPDGSTVPYVTFYTAPPSGADISVTYLGNAQYFYDTNNTVTIRDSVSVGEGNLLAITTFSSHDVYKIKTKVFVGTDQLTETEESVPGFDTGGFDVLGFDSIETVSLIKIAYPIDADQNDALKVYMSIDGIRQDPGYDYTVNDGIITLDPNIVITNTTVIVITWMSSNSYRPASTFQIFRSMTGEVTYSRLAVAQSARLTSDLTLTSTVVQLDDASGFDTPSPEGGSPGVIYINGERITYYTKSGNILGQIRRGVGGTGAKIHSIGSTVINVGPSTIIPNSTEGTWYNPGAGTASDGSGLQSSNTIPGRFITELDGLPIDT